ncbi:MAG TPA: hypothetical protein VMN39_04830 [Longimicrobiaceae bacterium]|nr:hypothetical protein [Longimicrobiaceae bacterium]
MTAYEGGEWDRVAALAPSIGLSAGDVPAIYLDAVEWAREQVGRAA